MTPHCWLSYIKPNKEVAGHNRLLQIRRKSLKRRQ
uniref:Uncharacterized protein n=1 Tax=Siphoviridae sp. ct4sp3 TaxID=2825332 RepID=A0A8S5PTN5_9CAUD|nr:MAG TPA: hypothetical protein [Siphoviridae sp. ct4sp3]